MDLLLFLVRREELDVSTISVSRILDQYLAFIEILQEIDLDSCADFLEVAAILVEQKSVAVLPKSEATESQGTSVLEDPREELVSRLLEYKRVRDAGRLLDDLADRWQQRYGRLADDLPPRRVSPKTEPLVDLELWDLVTAFGRLIREAQGPPPEQVVFDETPLNAHMETIHQRLCEEGYISFSDLFEVGMHKSALVGRFLALLELTRHHGAQVRQEYDGHEIQVSKGPNFQESFTTFNSP
jgi:segregation and condensation protein A